MTMKSHINLIYILAATITTIYLASSCHENIIDETTGDHDITKFEQIQITSKINIEDLPEDIQFSDLKIWSLNGENCISNDGTSEIMTYEGHLPQILMVTNSNDDVILMSRDGFHAGKENIISIRSTAIALVTMHPALSGAKSNVYEELVQLITESSSFNELEAAIAECVSNGRSFIDPENTVLTTALNNVFEQVVASSEEDLNDGELPTEDDAPQMPYSTATRAPELKGVTTIAGINVGPFHVTTSGSSVVIENYSLTPFYSGTVSHHGVTENFDVPSGDDRGITFFFNNSWSSNKVSYTFTQEGEYQFLFNKTTAESYLDQARHTICNILEVLGLPLEKKWIYQTATDIERFMAERKMDLVSYIINPNKSAWDIVKLVGYGTLDYVKEGHLEKMLTQIGMQKVAAQSVQTILKKFMSVYTIYEACRGSINAVMRITMRLESPDYVSFGLYYYKGEITTATRASIQKYSGDNQSGLIGHRLNEPARIKVTTIGSNETEVAASNFHRVKFSTELGNGTSSSELVATDRNGYAQTFWTLDPDNREPQYLHATVIDIVTGEEISDEVTFCAYPTQAANVTVTLDWSPTDSNCDIDLHIYDPNGHHICWYDMGCSCGGYLDRDDVHGPGPEHIYYTEAAPGKYRIYVHHYSSDTRGTVGFAVTTEYDDQRFVNRGSVSYHNSVYIGTLDVGGNSEAYGTRSDTLKPNVRFYYNESDATLFPTDSLPLKY